MSSLASVVISKPKPEPQVEYFDPKDVPPKRRRFFKRWLKRTLAYLKQDGTLGWDPHTLLYTHMRKRGPGIDLAVFFETLKKVGSKLRPICARYSLEYQMAQTARYYYRGLRDHKLRAKHDDDSPEIQSLNALVCALENSLKVLGSRPH